MNYKAALFDLDGVVVDTESQYSVFWGSQCRLYHPEIPGLENKIKGQTLTQIYDGWFSGEIASEQPLITRRLNEFEAQMDFDYIAGFEDFITTLRNKGFKTAVVTSSNKIKMNAVYRKHPEFHSLFDAILTSEDFSASKPDPDCYLKAAERFHLSPEECIVFEDSFNGLKSGRAAGMFVVGLATTNSAEQIAPFSDVVISDYVGLDFEKVEHARGVARKIADQVQDFVGNYTTVAVERTICRLLGIDGIDANEVPLPNVVVDELKSKGLLGQGVCFFMGNAILAMHSCRETGSLADHIFTVKAFTQFFK